MCQVKPSHCFFVSCRFVGKMGSKEVGMVCKTLLYLTDVNIAVHHRVDGERREVAYVEFVHYVLAV